MREAYYGRKRGKRWGIGLAAGLVVLAALVIFGLFQVREVVVVGNHTFTAKQIQQTVMQDGLCRNSLYLTWKFQDSDRASDALPFLSAVEVKLINPFKVQIHVYEKQEIGYFQTGGKYVYFDRDGMVIESSDTLHEDVPVVTGVSVTNSKLYDTLELSDETLLEPLLTLAASLSNEQLTPDEIRFSTSDEIILIFGKVKALLGKSENLEDKAAALASIYSQVEDKQGNLDMRNYSLTSQTVTFREGTDEEDTADSTMSISSGEAAGSDALSDGTSAQEQGDDSGTDSSDQTSDGSTSSGDVMDGVGGSFQTDSSGATYYMDEGGNTTYETDGYLYTNEDGSLITDGYGYCDPYTGYYYSYN